MRKEFRKELIKQFSQQVERRLPQFRGYENGREVTNDPMWAWELAPTLTYFVMLNIAGGDDDFAIEVAWSDDGKYPWRDIPHRFYEKVDLPRCGGRLSEAWVSGKREYRWAIVPRFTHYDFLARVKARERGEKVDRRPKPAAEALPRVGPLVEDAVQKLVDYGLPLFNRVAERRGIGWPLPAVDDPPPSE